MNFIKKNIHGVKASINRAAISRIMYADNIILFSKATRKDASTLLECLEKYCHWSGEKLNNSKSGIFFSKYTQKQTARAIKHIFWMMSSKKDAVYLGAPMFLSKSPSKDLSFH